MRKFWTILIMLALAASSIIESVESANVILDQSFGNGGKVVTQFSIAGAGVSALALQADGKVVAAGWAEGSLQNDFAIARYQANGSLDTGFGNGGKKTVDFNGQEDLISAVALQADGKIVVAGRAHNGTGFDSAIARFNPDGSLDTAFDTDGRLIVDFGFSDYASGLAIQSDGKIIIAGRALNSAGYSDMALARLNSDGSLDANFGTGGKVTTDFYGLHDVANCVLIQPADGKIVLAGFAQTTFVKHDRYNDFAVARYFADGTPDNSFDTDGKATTDFFGFGDEANAIVLQNDGKIVVGGGAGQIYTEYDFALARYNTNGSLDNNFGQSGKATTDFGVGANKRDAVFALALQPNGRMIAAGHADFSYSALARFNNNGSLDLNFSTDGKITNGVGGPSYALLIQPDAKILTAGSGRLDTGSYGFGLQRYFVPAIPSSKPSDFDGDGKSDLAVFRPATGQWIVRHSTDNVVRVDIWGMSGDVAVPADYDLDGKTDVAIYRPSNGSWYIHKSSDGGTLSYYFGVGTDIPVPADYDGDGKVDIAVFRPSNGAWYMLRSSDGSFTAQHFGNNDDWPVPGDYDEDGKANFAVFRRTTGVWYIALGPDYTSPVSTAFGSVGDKPVRADYDGDGKTDIAVFRPANGNWYVLPSSNNTALTQPWGLSTDRPVPGDYDGDNKIDFAVWRPGNLFWYILQSSDNQLKAVQLTFSNSADVPVTSAYIP